MRDLGNTLIVVEHDEDTMREADWLIDVGPGAGAFGGQIMASGTPEEVAKNKKSITGQYLSGAKSIPVPTKQMPDPCNHRQQGLFVPPQDYPCHVPMPADSLFYP